MNISDIIMLLSGLVIGWLVTLANLETAARFKNWAKTTIVSLYNSIRAKFKK